MRAIGSLALVVLVASGLSGCRRWRRHPTPSVTAAPALTAGAATTCLAASDGATCWGRATHGASRSVVGLEHGAHVVAGSIGGTDLVCGAQPEGEVVCVRDGVLLPARGLRGARELATDGTHLCARMPDGAVRCAVPGDRWPQPSDVGALHGALRLAGAGGIDTPLGIASMLCGVLASRRAVCLSGAGPVTLPGRGVVDVSTYGARACTVDARGAVACVDVIADGCTEPWTAAGAFPRARRVAVGARHVCVVTRGGGVACGGGDEHGQSGDGQLRDAATASVTSGVTGVREVAAGEAHTCVRTAAGASCFGSGAEGASGPGSGAAVSRTLVPGVVSIAAAAGVVCATTETGALECFGDNTHGDVGDGTHTWRGAATRATAFGDLHVAGVALAEGQSCALVDDGRVACRLGTQAAQPVVPHATGLALDGMLWTLDASGAISAHDPSRGNGLAEVGFATAGVVPGASDLAGTEGTACVRAGGGAWCIASSRDGLRGDGSTSDWPEATRVASAVEPGGGPLVACAPRCGPPLEGVAQLAMRGSVACARLESGRVACWGSGLDRLADAMPPEAGRPVYVPGIDDAQDLCLASGLCVRHGDGRVTCTGDVALEGVDLRALTGGRGLACDRGRVCTGQDGHDVVCVSAPPSLGAVVHVPRPVAGVARP